MESPQKFLNDRLPTGMEKYSVIKLSGRKLVMKRQCDDATIPLFFTECTVHRDIWSVSGPCSASVHGHSKAREASRPFCRHPRLGGSQHRQWSPVPCHTPLATQHLSTLRAEHSGQPGGESGRGPPQRGACCLSTAGEPQSPVCAVCCR